MVSVLVSVADSYATKPLPLKRFGMEAEVGSEPSCPKTWSDWRNTTGAGC